MTCAAKGGRQTATVKTAVPAGSQPCQGTATSTTITEPTGPSAAQEVVHGDVEAIRQALDGADLEVALSPLQGTDIGPVHAQYLGERFLTESFGHTVSTQIAAETGQRFAFHGGQDDR